jgi:hypothetical protein
MAAAVAALILLGAAPAWAEIVVQVFPKTQYLPADQILSESGLGMTRWVQTVQWLPNGGKPVAISGKVLGNPCNRHIKIAYIYVAATDGSHTAGQGSGSQCGAITAESQADAARHELWHVEIARAAAAKANELEAKLIALAFSEQAAASCESQNAASEIMARIDQAVTRRYHGLRQTYNAKLDAISSAAVVDGVWRDNQPGQTAEAVSELLAELRAEPSEEEVKVAENSPQS